MYDADKAIFKRAGPYTKRALSLKGASARTEITLQKAENACVISKYLYIGRKYAILRQVLYLIYNQPFTQKRAFFSPISPRQNMTFTHSLWPF